MKLTTMFMMVKFMTLSTVSWWWILPFIIVDIIDYIYDENENS